MIKDIEEYPYRTLPLRKKNKLKQYGRMLDNCIVYSIVNSAPTTNYWLRVPQFKFICGIQFGTQTLFNPSSNVRMYETYTSTGSNPENYKIEAAIMQKAFEDHRVIPHYWPNVDYAAMWHSQLGYGATTTKETIRLLARKLQQLDDIDYTIDNSYVSPINLNDEFGLAFLYLPGLHLDNWAGVGFAVPDGYQIEAHYSNLVNPNNDYNNPSKSDQNYIICSYVPNQTGNSMFGIDKLVTYDTGLIAIPQNLCRMFVNLNTIPDPKNPLGNRDWMYNIGQTWGSFGSSGMNAPKDTSTIKLPNGRFAAIVKNFQHLINLGKKGAEGMKMDEVISMINAVATTAIFAYAPSDDPRISAKFGPSGSGPANSQQRKEYYKVRDRYAQSLQSADSMRQLIYNQGGSRSGYPDISFG